MTSGNRPVFIVSLLAAASLLIAADAHAPAESRLFGMAGAQELLDCPSAANARPVELTFETSRSEPVEELHQLLTQGPQRAIGFEWHPDTGELSYRARATFMPLGDRGRAAAIPVTVSCE